MMRAVCNDENVCIHNESIFFKDMKDIGKHAIVFGQNTTDTKKTPTSTPSGVHTF